MRNESEKKQSCIDNQTSDIHQKLIINIRNLDHIMHFLYEGKASQKRILMILNEVNCITQRDLTSRLGIQPGSVSEILTKLENANLIERKASETDRRTANILLTEQGKQMAEEALEQREQRHLEMFSCLSEKEKEELLHLMEKVHQDWKNRYKPESRHKSGHHDHKHGHRHKHHCELEKENQSEC